MKHKLAITINLFLLTMTLVACGQGTEKKTTATSTTKSIVSSTSTIEPITSTTTTESTVTDTITTSVESTPTSTSKSDQATPSESSQAPIETTKITTHDQAVQFLMAALTELDQDDTVYIDWGKGENDKGTYFDLKLASKSIQANGGSGTIGIYRVFADGTYDLYPED